MSPHPNLAEEQAYIAHAYSCLTAMRERIARLSPGGAHPGAAQAVAGNLARRMEALRETDEPICFGRIDETAGDRWYIGRLGIEDDKRDAVVVDWRADVATPFYQARVGNHLGIWLRRRFTFDSDPHHLVDITDEYLAERPDDTDDSVPAGTPTAEIDEYGILGRDPLLADLGRRRTGEMRDIVATIQAEQDQIIRSPREGVLVVQGGPGTGKTAVGLHRAAWLLYTFREDLETARVLVVGPNSAFINYIEQVLPALGEAAVSHLPVTRFVSARVGGRDSEDARRLKGDPRMATLIELALDDRIKPLREELVFNLSGVVARLTPGGTADTIQAIRTRSSTYQGGRDRLRETLLDQLADQYVAGLNQRGDSVRARNAEEQRQRLRRSREFESALDRMWETVTPQVLLRDLFGGPRRMRRIADGLLSREEQLLLSRDMGDTAVDSLTWTQADLPLLDEARTRIDGPPATFGYLIIDEAQDLSPMQLRMVGRRCRTGSMTLLGDLAQASGTWAHTSWDEILEHLPTGTSVAQEELTIGYRVPEEVFALANGVLAVAAPSITPPRSVRSVGAEPEILYVDAVDVARRAMEQARSLTGDDRHVGVIAPESLVAGLRAQAEAMSLDYGEALRDGLAHPVTIVPAWAAKGLEFDCAVVVEPAQIAGTTHRGLRLLYVALTRVTQRLTIVHSEPLPVALSGDADDMTAESDGERRGVVDHATGRTQGGISEQLLMNYRSMDDVGLWAHTRAAVQALGERLGLHRGSDGES